MTQRYTVIGASKLLEKTGKNMLEEHKILQKDEALSERT